MKIWKGKNKRTQNSETVDTVTHTHTHTQANLKEKSVTPNVDVESNMPIERNKNTKRTHLLVLLIVIFMLICVISTTVVINNKIQEPNNAGTIELGKNISSIIVDDSIWAGVTVTAYANGGTFPNRKFDFFHKW